MPRYDDGDSENPDYTSWFEDNPYNDGDSDNPDNFSGFEDSLASSGAKDSYHDHLRVPDFTTMDPDQDHDFNASPGRAPSAASRTSSRNSSQQLPPSSDIVLRISPAAGSTIFGYILIAENERHQENAISAFFENTGREVTVLPCPNFANFLLDHSLQERNISLIIDLPHYIIPAGIRILQANKYSALPNQEWLPAPPDLSSFNALYQHSSHRSSLSLRPLLSRCDAHGNQHPDPDGIDSSLAHLSFYHLAHRALVPAISMGGNPGSHGGFSPLTHQGSGSLGGGGRSMGGGDSVQRPVSVGGGTVHTSPALQAHPMSSSGTPAPAFVPLAQPDVSSAISVVEDSLSDPSVPNPLAPPALAIKDKAADLGLKDIFDKASWIEAKKIIDARLRCPPYCPGPNSKALITTTANAIASSWWEEVINYYVKPPISDLFVEESRFDGKGFKMIEHIDKYFDPSGAVDSLGHIFYLIDIKQTQDESVITLKA
jgi:hypothetical protein